MKKSLLMLSLGAAVALASCSDSNNDGPKITIDPVLPPDVSLATTADIDLSAAESEQLKDFNDITFRIDALVRENARSIYDNADANYALSPLSIMLCQALMANGADAPADNVIARAMGSADIAALNSLCNKLLKYLPAAENGVDLALAQSVWLSSRFAVTDRYKTVMAESFGAPVASIDFTDPDAVDIINRWCDEQTHGLIKAPLKYLPGETASVWANAMYFRGAWDKVFDASATVMSPFHGVAGDVDVPVMHARYMMEYSEAAGLQRVSVPFKGNNYTLDVILGVPEDGIASESWRALDSSRSHCMVDLSLPRFEIYSEAVMNEILERLGMFDAESITFGAMGIPAEYDLLESPFLCSHHVSVTVDEEGATAGAVTINRWVTSDIEAPAPREVTFTADRPFTYCIRNVITGVVILTGRVNSL